MKKILIVFFLISAFAFADDWVTPAPNYIVWPTGTQPVCAANFGCIYFNGTVFKVSQNGGAYGNLVGAGGGGVSDQSCTAGQSVTGIASGTFTCDSHVTFDNENNSWTGDNTWTGGNQLFDSNVAVIGTKVLSFRGLGSPGLAFRAPATVTSSQICTLEDDASFIPDNCVGDGVDGGTNILTASGTLDFADPGTNNCTAELTIALSGSIAGSPCSVGSTATSVTQIVFFCRVASNDVVSVKACKYGSAAENPSSGTFKVAVTP